MRIVVVAGTNRAGALSTTLAGLVASEHRRLGADTDLLDLAQMGPEFLLPNAYKEPAPAVTALVERFLASDGAVFVIPEYNGSYPGALKLFVDMLPYPEGFDRRPCAFIGLAAGRWAGLRAVEHFQQVAGYRNAHQYPQRLLIGDSYRAFTEGRLADPEIADRLTAVSAGFQGFVTALTAASTN